MAAWSSFPTSFLMRLKGTPLLIRRMAVISFSIDVCFFSASSMHRVSPSNTQLRILFLTSHWPSPSISFPIDTSSSPTCPVMACDKNTLYIPCSSVRLHRQSASSLSVCASWMKYSTWTSILCRNFALCCPVMDITAGVSKASGMVRYSNGCSCRAPCSSATYNAATSRAVSDYAQKNGE